MKDGHPKMSKESKNDLINAINAVIDANPRQTCYRLLDIIQDLKDKNSQLAEMAAKGVPRDMEGYLRHFKNLDTEKFK